MPTGRLSGSSRPTSISAFLTARSGALDQVERAEHGGVVMMPVAQEVENREAALIDHDGLAVDETRLHRQV
jgi:hypothetical protein